MDQANTDSVIHRTPFWCRLTAAVVILTFSGLVTAPAVAATRAEVERQERAAPREQGNAEKLNATLREIRDQLCALAGKPDATNRIASNDQRKAARETLKELHAQLRELDKAAREDFRAIEEDLKQKNLSDAILQRHFDAVAKYEAEADALLNELQVIDTAGEGVAETHALKALERLEKHQLQRTHKPFDPERMPFGIPKAKDLPEPAITPEQFLKRDALGLFDTHNADDGGTSTLSAALNDTAITNFDLNDPSDPAYLAETLDVQITPAIEALAAQLEHNPVKIHNWVHNHIDYLPTYGSVQGAQLTLDNKKGNAFDIASLTIALLRASDIPARYAYGTVELPIDKAMNWLGNLESPSAAGNLLGQGGIPNVLIVNGGQVTHLRMEHIWVEAWVDFYPSRGAINRIGDSWVPMDASYKQYAYVAAPDFDDVVELDEAAIESELRETLEVDESLGYIRNVNEVVLQGVISDIQAQVENHAANNDISLNPATYGRQIQQQSYPILAGSLSMHMPAKAGSYAEIPGTKRLAGAVIVSGETAFSKPFSEILSAEITLDYVAATDDDAALILEYGGRFNVPAYLLSLKPRVMIDGEVIWTGAAVPFGEPRFIELQIREPGQNPTRIENKVYSGGSYAIAFNGPALGEEFSEVLTKLASQILPYDGNEDAYYQAQFPKQLHLSLMTYFWQVDMMSGTIAISDGVVRYGMPSVGMFNTNLEIFTYFGIPKTVGISGVTIDVDQYYGSAADKNNDTDSLIVFNESVGSMASGYEHAIMQQLYDDEGISSIRALQVANERGLKLFRVTSQNLSAVLPLLDVSYAVRADVQNAVYAGKIVTIPESEMQINDWYGIGYIISDTETGGAAYLISGGLNGGGTTSGKSASSLFANFVEYMSCVISDGYEWLTIAAGAILYRAAFIARFISFFGPLAGPIIFWLGVALLLAAYLQAVVSCYAPAVTKRYGWAGGKYDA